MSHSIRSAVLRLNPGLTFYKDQESDKLDRNFKDIIADESDILKSVELLMSSSDLDAFGEADQPSKWWTNGRRSG
jgi:hypothetical protein